MSKPSLTPTPRKPSEPRSLEAWVSGESAGVPAESHGARHDAPPSPPAPQEAAQSADLAPEPPEDIDAESLPSRSARSSARRGSVKRADGRELVRLQVYLPPDVARAFAVYCAQRDTEKSAVVHRLIRRLLSKADS